MITGDLFLNWLLTDVILVGEQSARILQYYSDLKKKKEKKQHNLWLKRCPKFREYEFAAVAQRRGEMVW